MPSDQAAVNRSKTHTTHQDKQILDGLIGITGFGLCRAWIVFCLAAPLGFKASFSTDWIYLLCGAMMALIIAFIVKRLGAQVQALRRNLYRVTAVALSITVVLVPIGLTCQAEILLLIGFIVGGAGAGMLQVLWGERFASYQISYATIVSPAAAIITALFVSFAATQGLLVLGFAVFPVLSYVLLLVIAVRGGLTLHTLFRGDSPSSEAGELPAQTATEEDALGVSKKDAFGLDLENGEQHQAQKNPRTHNGSIESLVPEPSQNEKEEPRKRRPWANNVGKLMFSIMLFSFLCRVFDAVPLSGADPFAPVGGSPLMALVVVGALFLLFAAVLKDRFNPTLTYRLSLPIMVAGFVAIALFFDTYAALSIMLINIGYEFFDILSWILFTEVSRRKNEQPLRIFGLGVAFMFIGMSLGLLCGQIFNSLVLSGEVQITVVAMLSILSLVIVAFLVIPEGTIEHLANAISADKKEQSEDVPSTEAASKRQEDEESNGNESSIEGRLEVHCATAATDYRLTPRESEVLVLLAYGRTLAIIARDLQIANGTARTHIENIYRKLDVHKQQELIDLIEDYEKQGKTGE